MRNQEDNFSPFNESSSPKPSLNVRTEHSRTSGGFLPPTTINCDLIQYHVEYHAESSGFSGSVSRGGLSLG